MTERGSAPLELALGVLAILIPIAFLVLSFGPWMARRTFTRLAAAEAARYVAVSDGDEVGAAARVAEMAANNGFAPSAVKIALCGGEVSVVTGPPVSTCLDAGGDLARGGTVEVRIEIEVPLVQTPYGPVGAVTAAHEHSEFVDLYRSLP